MRHLTIGSCILTFANLAILASLTIVNEAVADETINPTFPYTTYVLENGSYVRSGPGKAYYPTERLKAGDAVEVYRHDPGGWLAIRPTKNSFTWVRSRYLKPLGDGLAEVTGEKVAARMGSRLDDSKDVIQVKLHKGETVELVDPKSMDGGTNEPWVKIRPPSGEFRWIHSSLVDLESNASGLRSTHRNSAPIVPRTTRETTSRPPQRAIQPRNEPERRPAAPPQTTNSLPYNGQPMQFAHDERPQPNYREATRRTNRDYSNPPVNNWDFEEALAELEIELSEMVASDPNTWSFDRIAMDAESLAGYSRTAIERGRIREILSKIDRFEELQDRKTQLNQMIAQHERQRNQLAMRSERMSQTSNATDRGYSVPTTAHVAMATFDNRFDGTGILRRVKPVSEGAPNYALLDEAGRIRCFVTPAPDVSLDYYENREIGVTGNRGYMPNQRKHHVMAKHVQLLR